MTGGVEFPLPDLAATDALARRFAPLIRPRAAMVLRGDLGAGKTTFAQRLLWAAGVKDEVTSPTFTLAHRHEALACPIYHFDWYRLKTPEEVENLGLDDALAHGAAIIEWPERAEAYVPRDAASVRFVFDGALARAAIVHAPGFWSAWQEEEGAF